MLLAHLVPGRLWPPSGRRTVHARSRLQRLVFPPFYPDFPPTLTPLTVAPERISGHKASCQKLQAADFAPNRR